MTQTTPADRESDDPAERRGRRGRYLALAGLLVVSLVLSALHEFAAAGVLAGSAGLLLLIAGVVRRSGQAASAGLMCVFLGMTAWVVTLFEQNTLLAGPAARGGQVLITVLCLATPVIVGLTRRRSLPQTALAWKCRGCGHDLFGLLEPRCPECGRTVDPDQVAKAPPGMFLFTETLRDE